MNDNRGIIKKTVMVDVEAFKSAVIKTRDILRGLGITGMDSMRHICLYVMSRYITRERAHDLGVPEVFCWDNLMNLIDREQGGVQKALDLFNHKDAEPGERFIEQFDRLFGTQKFDFTVNDKNRHKEILELFRGVNLENVDCGMDILGWVYEQHLKTGATSARDLGQFFTDRAICKYMINLCKPGFKSPGVPETVCDPAMGTGGFLTSFIKYYHEKYPAQVIDWNVQMKEIFGCDNDPKVAGVARMNLFMETKGAHISEDNITTKDSLREGPQRDNFNIIVANMPFGLRGLRYAECCLRVKDLRIEGTKSEPLFLQLMMTSLAPGGRCAVIVPDGMLSNCSKLHNGTRQYLVENFELQRVIKMSGQFFMNTGIQPSILYFANTEFSTGDIEFYEINKNTDGTITERLVVTVDRDNLDDSFSLDMRGYMPVEDAHIANDLPTVQLSEVLNIVSGKANTNRSDDFAVPYYDSNGPIGHVAEPLYTGEYVITARKLSIGAIHYVNGPFYPSDNTINFTTKDSNRLLTKFFYHWLLLNNHLLKRLSKGVKPGIRKSDVVKIVMPIPPHEVQETVVHALDNIYEVRHGATTMIAQLRTQVNDITMASLSREHNTTYQVRDLASCNPRSVKEKRLDIIQYLELGSVKKGDILNYQTIPFDERPSSASKYVDVNDIIWGKCRPLSRSYAFIEVVPENLIVSSAFIIIKTTRLDIILPEYLYYVIITDHCVNYLSNCSKGLYPGMHANDILKYTVNIPSIEVQQEMLTQIHLLRAQIKSLTQTQERSENIARFILTSYLSAPIIAEPIAEPPHEFDEVYPEENHDDGASSSGTSHDDDEADE